MILEGRRTEIMDAALAEFNRHGVAGAAIDEIRRRSGASIGSIYHHFGGKLELAGTLYLEGMASYQEGFVAELGRAAGTRQGIEGVVHHHLSWVAEHRELARFLFLRGDAPRTRSGERPLNQLNRRFFAQVKAWTAPRLAAGELRNFELEVMSALWIGPSQELARLWLEGRSRISPIDAAPQLAEAAWRSLCP